MKITIDRLLGIRATLEAIFKTDSTSPVTIDGVARYNLVRNYNKTKSALSDYEAVRNELIKKHGEPGPDDSVSVSKPAALAAFREELLPIHKEELEVDLRQVTEKALADSNLSMAIQSLLLSHDLVKEEPVK